MATTQTLAPDLALIETLAQAAVERLPELFRKHLAHVVLRVEDFADDANLDEMGIESEFDLLGLYRGLPLGAKSVDHSGAMPDMIHLYRRPMLEYWAETGESLEAVVTHVLVHEVGHHFGLSDADMKRIEREAV